MKNTRGPPFYQAIAIAQITLAPRTARLPHLETSKTVSGAAGCKMISPKNIRQVVFQLVQVAFFPWHGSDFSGAGRSGDLHQEGETLRGFYHTAQGPGTEGKGRSCAASGWIVRMVDGGWWMVS